MKIGVITDCFKKSHSEGIIQASKLGMHGVQIYATTGEFSPETLNEDQKREYKKLLLENGLVVSALCGDMGGFGFEIEKDNKERIEKTKDIIDLAVEFSTNVVTTHIGVIPDDKSNPRYKILLDALTECGLYAKSKGVTLAIETGPEKAKTLLAFLEDPVKHWFASSSTASGSSARNSVRIIRFSGCRMYSAIRLRCLRS